MPLAVTLSSSSPPWILFFAAVAVMAAPLRADEPVLPEVAAAMQKYVDAGEISGCVTLVIDRGKTVHHGATGLADIEHKTPMSLDVPFAIASMTKPVTATALMTLVDAGKVSVDDPVTKYLPEFAAAKLADAAPVGEIKLRHLLTHTSGLVGSQDCHGSLEETCRELVDRPFGFQPGQRWEYSPGLNVIGRVIEVVSGRSFEDYLRETILAPLHMDQTWFHPPADQLARVAQVYARTGNGPLTLGKRTFATGLPEECPSPSGGLISTAADMGRFYQMVLNGGQLEGRRILSEEAVRTMTSRQTADDIVTGFTPGNGWGLGWCVVRNPQGITGDLSPGSYGHGGYFGTQGVVDPAKQRIYVLLYQRVGLPNSDGAEIRRDFYHAAATALQTP